MKARPFVHVDLTGGCVHSIHTNIPELERADFLFTSSDREDANPDAVVRLSDPYRERWVYTVKEAELCLTDADIAVLGFAADDYRKRLGI